MTLSLSAAVLFAAATAPNNIIHYYTFFCLLDLLTPPVYFFSEPTNNTEYSLRLSPFLIFCFLLSLSYHFMCMNIHISIVPCCKKSYY